MPLARPLIAIAIGLCVIAWIRRDYPFELREAIPFASGQQPGVYDAVQVAMIAIAARAAQRITQREATQ